MPSMHQMQEMTSEEKWNAYEARRAARRQLRRGGVTAAPSTPKPDLADIALVPEEPEKGTKPQPQMPYSLSIDLSGVAAEEETLELENAPTRRSDTIEVEAPIGRDAFVLGKTLEPHQSEEGANDTTMVDDIPGWVARRRLTRQSRTIEAEAPTRGDAFIPEQSPRTRENADQ
ncbi:hypothetical protein H4582DRAFT_2069131 [Lactarius indigo]|nr:hypothetical protein H4582DRAFT_2069131 [Lactarius indigo]